MSLAWAVVVVGVTPVLAAGGCGRTDLLAGESIVLAATTDAFDAVHLRWTAHLRSQPSGYLVRRDGTALAILPATARLYDDAAVEPGELSAPASLTASRGTRADAVALAWSDARTAGARHRYQVSALVGTTETLRSSQAEGARGAPAILGYEFSRDDGESWLDAGTATTFDDTGAPQGRITASAEATARYSGNYVRVRVTAEPSIAPPVASTYRVRARTSSGVTPPSPPAQGYRSVGDVIAYQWQRSAGDSDGGYADLPDVTGSICAP